MEGRDAPGNRRLEQVEKTPNTLCFYMICRQPVGFKPLGDLEPTSLWHLRGDALMETRLDAGRYGAIQGPKG